MQGATSLLYALNIGNFTIVELVLVFSRGANLMVIDEQGMAAPHRAAISSNCEAVECGC